MDKKMRLAGKNEDGVKVTLVGQKIGGAWYGIGRAWLLGQGVVAVKAGAQRCILANVNQARVWFRAHGLTAEQAQEMVTEGLAKWDAKEVR